MALLKFLQGNAGQLDNYMRSSGKEGWIYITKDTGDMYIQAKDNSTDGKIHLNANYANKLRVENTGDVNTPVYFENGIPKVTTGVATVSSLIGVIEDLDNYIKKPPAKNPTQQVTTNAIVRWEGTNGEVKNSSIIIEDVTNESTHSLVQTIAIPASGGKKIVYGQCTDQSDGTSFIGGLFSAGTTKYPHTEGLAIGGTSGNLLWKGQQVATTDMIPIVNDGILTIQRNSTTVGTFTANQATNSNINIIVPTKASDIGAAPSTHTHTKSQISDFPTIPTVYNGTLTIKKNGTSVGTFTANQSTPSDINITVPTNVSELTNDSGYKTTDYYHTPTDTTLNDNNGLRIATGVGVSHLYVPIYSNNSTSGTRSGIVTLPSIHGGNSKFFREDGQWADIDVSSITVTTKNSGWIYLTGITASSFNTSAPLYVTYNSSESRGPRIDTATKALYGAVWNDYAECRETKEDIKPGRVVCETGKGDLVLSTERLQAGANIVSDTFGFIIGETSKAKTPIAVSGRALAYPLENKTSYAAGDAVCAGPNGTVSKMTREEIREYPDRILGTVSEIPDYEVWGENDIIVDGRIWIKVK